MKQKKSPLYRMGKTLIITFIIGNGVAFSMGAGVHQFLPEEQKSVETLNQLHTNDPENPEYSVALGTLYFLANRLDEAENILATVPQQYVNNTNVKLLSNSIAIKRSGEMLDLLFGQVKLYQLNQSVDELYNIAQSTSGLDTQVFVLSTLSELTDVGESEERGLILAQKVESQLSILEPEGALPVDLGVSVYQALSNMYLMVIKNDKQEKDYQQLATTALNKYDKLYNQIESKPGWLKEGNDLIESRRRYLN